MTHTTSLFLALLCNMQRNFMFWTIFFIAFLFVHIRCFLFSSSKDGKNTKNLFERHGKFKCRCCFKSPFTLISSLIEYKYCKYNFKISSTQIGFILHFVLFFFCKHECVGFHVEHTEILIDFIFGNNIWKWCVKTS